MSDLVEGIGGAIEGALVGGAVEPRHGEASDNNSGESSDPATCSNCGGAVSGTYCPDCGQKRHVHRTLSAIGHDLMHGVLHLDGKFWNTIPLLAFKPGKLTRRYIDGERAKFVSPMAMFLFSVFAMFAVFQMVGMTVPADLSETEIAESAFDNAKAQAEREQALLQAELDTLPEGENNGRRQELEQAIAELEQGIGSIQDVAEIEFDTAQEDPSLTGNDWIDNGIIKKWRQNPSLMLYKLQANAYKFSWLLIPLSIPFVWLLFAWKRRFKAYDHAVFVTYSLSFMSLLFIAMSLIGISPLGAGWAGLMFVAIVPLHIYKQLKYTYDLSRVSTLWRLFVLLHLITIVIGLFIQALLLLGAF